MNSSVMTGVAVGRSQDDQMQLVTPGVQVVEMKARTAVLEVELR